MVTVLGLQTQSCTALQLQGAALGPGAAGAQGGAVHPSESYWNLSSKQHHAFLGGGVVAEWNYCSSCSPLSL